MISMNKQMHYIKENVIYTITIDSEEMTWKIEKQRFA